MIVQKAWVGARGVDSLQFSQTGSRAQAEGMRRAGADFFVGYLGAMSPLRLQFLIESGLAFMPVTFANQFDGPRAVAQCMNLGLPAGCTVWLDLEGKAVYDMRPDKLSGIINAWADAVARGGYQPGLYVGSPQPLTSEELFALHCVRYWDAMSEECDRFGKLARPRCGFCMSQLNPSRDWGGVWSDIDFIGQDFLGRLPSWVQGAPPPLEDPTLDEAA